MFAISILHLHQSPIIRHQVMMVVLVISLMSSDDELNYYYVWIEFSND